MECSENYVTVGDFYELNACKSLYVIPPFFLKSLIVVKQVRINDYIGKFTIYYLTLLTILKLDVLKYVDPHLYPDFVLKKFLKYVDEIF